MDESEAELAAFAGAIADFFSGRPLSDTRDAFLLETTDRGVIDTEFNARTVASPHFARLDDLDDDPGSSAGTDAVTVDDEARIDRHGTRGGSGRTSPPLDEKSAIVTPREIERLIARHSPEEMHPSPGFGGSSRSIHTPVRAAFDSWQVGPRTQFRSRPDGEDLRDVRLPRDPALIARLAMIEPGDPDREDDRRNSRVATFQGFGSDNDRLGPARGAPEMTPTNRAGSSQIEIPSGRMITDPEGFAPRDISPPRPVRTGVGLATDAQGFDSAWPGGMQADLLRMSELLEILVAEAVRGRLGSMPGPGPRPHSLR